MATDRAAIEAEVGLTLDWLSTPEKRRKTVTVTTPFDLRNREAWPKVTAWFAEHAPKVYAAFSKRLAALPAEAFSVLDSSGAGSHDG